MEGLFVCMCHSKHFLDMETQIQGGSALHGTHSSFYFLNQSWDYIYILLKWDRVTDRSIIYISSSVITV